MFSITRKKWMPVFLKKKEVENMRRFYHLGQDDLDRYISSDCSRTKKKWKIYAVDIIWVWTLDDLGLFIDPTLAAQEQKVATKRSLGYANNIRAFVKLDAALVSPPVSLESKGASKEASYRSTVYICDIFNGPGRYEKRPNQTMI